MENGKVPEISQNELDSLFYKAINRRALLDVVQDTEEQTYWEKCHNESNDITLYSWRNDWLKNLKGNLECFNSFRREHSAKVFYNELIDRPIILVGAGPSLQKNIHYLKLAKALGIKIMASHHSLMYLAQEGVQVVPDFVCALDAGVMWDDYFAFDKLDCSSVPLFADITCSTEQIKKWKGPVYFYKSEHPSESNIGKYLKMEIERFVPPRDCPTVISVGGHVLGAMLSIAKGIMQSNMIIFVGCDYCFSFETGKFYPFSHKIDEVVTTENHDGSFSEKPAPPPPSGEIYDIFGNRVATNNSYLGFKNVMDLGIKVNKVTAMANNQELDFIHACEGGALGALDNGNSKFMLYMRLEDACHYVMNKMAAIEVAKVKAEKAKK